MPQQVRHVKQRSIPFGSGRQKEKLDRGMIYRELYLTLKGTANLDPEAEELPVTTIQRGSEWNLLDLIEVKANSSDYIKSIDGPALVRLNRWFYGTAPKLTEYSQLEDDVFEFNSSLIVPFWMPRSFRPIDTALDARELSALEVRATWNDGNALFGVGFDGWEEEPEIKMTSLNSFGAKGPFAQWRLNRITEDVVSEQNERRIELTPNHMYRAFLINTTEADQSEILNRDRIDNPDVLNRIKITSGSTTFAEYDVDTLQRISPLRMGLDRPGYSLGTFADELLYEDIYPVMSRDNDPADKRANDPDAWYYLDLVTDGFLTESIDTLGFTDFQIEVDQQVPEGAEDVQIHVYPSRVIPVRGSGNGNGNGNG